MAQRTPLRLAPPAAAPRFTASERATLLTIPAVAERLGISRRSVYDLLNARSLPYVLQKGARRVRLIDLVAYCEQLDGTGRPGAFAPPRVRHG